MLEYILLIWLGGYVSVTAQLLLEETEDPSGGFVWYELFYPLAWPLNLVFLAIVVVMTLYDKFNRRFMK